MYKPRVYSLEAKLTHVSKILLDLQGKEWLQAKAMLEELVLAKEKGLK